MKALRWVHKACQRLDLAHRRDIAIYGNKCIECDIGIDGGKCTGSMNDKMEDEGRWNEVRFLKIYLM